MTMMMPKAEGSDAPMNCDSLKLAQRGGLKRSTLLVFLGGLLVGAAGWASVNSLRHGQAAQGEELLPGIAFPTILRDAHAALDEGDYEFYPNRRSIWVVNRTNGRMASYTFHDDELGSVDRSRIAMLDTRAFPRADTVIHLSDRNLNNILWVCNTRTGDMQMWTIARDGSLKGETPIASSTDLTERAAASKPAQKR